MKKLAVAAVAGLSGLFIAGAASSAPLAPSIVSGAKVEGASTVQPVHYRYRHYRRHHGFYGYRPSYFPGYGRRYYYGGYPAYGYVRPYYGPSFSITIGRGSGRGYRW